MGWEHFNFRKYSPTWYGRMTRGYIIPDIRQEWLPDRQCDAGVLAMAITRAFHLLVSLALVVIWPEDPNGKRVIYLGPTLRVNAK